jgi:ATP-dependent Clp protease ATP-binding subunit ClpA
VPLSGPARRAIGLAGQEARQAGHQRVGTGDLLLGLLAGDTDEHNTAFGVLDLLGIEYVPVRRLLEHDHASLPARTPFTVETTGVLTRAEQDAQRTGRIQIGTAELLVALLAESETDTEATGGAVVVRVLAQLGAEPDLLRSWILDALLEETEPAERNTSTPPAEMPSSGGESGPAAESAAPWWRCLGEQVRARIQVAWHGARHWVRTILAPRAT